MKKRIVSLLLALLLFAAMPVMSAHVFADANTFEYRIGAETMKMICQKNGLDYDFCWKAILQLNSSEFDVNDGEDAFKSLVYGTVITLPKTNQDAATVLGVALPARLKNAAATTTATTTTTASGTTSTAAAGTGATKTVTIQGGDTAISICNANGISFATCKAAIMKLNNFASDYSFLTLKSGNKLIIPATNADAAVITATASTGTATAASTGTATGTTTGTAATTTSVSSLLPSGNAVAAYMVPHVVQAGETIYGICQANNVDFAKYGNLIMQASGVTYATGLHVGDVVYIPSASAVNGAFSIVMHTVSTGETTMGICQALGVNYGDNLKLITALNPGKNLSNIHTGDILLFPKKA